MESRKRNLWIVLAAIVVIACCCALATAVAGGVWLTQWQQGREPGGRYQESFQETFQVGDAPSLQIDHFAGKVTIRAGERGRIRVEGSKRASSSRNLRLIGVGMHQTEDGLVIRTGRPLMGNASLDLEITTPPDTRLVLRLDAGDVLLQGLTGGVDADVAAGNVTVREVVGDLQVRGKAGLIDVQEAAGPVRLRSDVGVVLYQGSPRGNCTFESDIGAIGLVLPADPDVAVDVQTGMGIIDLGCEVEGTLTSRRVEGVIGGGGQGTILARSRMGSISLDCR